MTMQEKENKFDLYVRSVMSDAAEEVPSGVWESVSARLDAAAPSRGKVIPAWWWRVGAGLAAAAAAVALVLVPWGRNNSTDHILPEGSGDNIAVVPSSPVTPGPCVSEESPEKVSGTSSVRTNSSALLLSANRSLIAMVESPVPVNTIPRRAFSNVSVIAAEEAEEWHAAPYKSPQEQLNDIIYDEMMRSKSYRPHLGSVYAGGDVSTNGSASPLHLGLHRSPAAPPVSTGVTELSKESSYSIPVSFGVGARFGITKRFSVGTGLTYSLLSRSFTGTYNQVEGGVIVKSVTSEITNIQQYLGLPVTLYYDIIHTRPVLLYTHAGGMVERSVLNRYNIHSSPDPIIHTESPRGVQWSAAIGLGAEFRLSNSIGLYVDPSLRYYFDCKQPRSIRTQQPLMMNLDVGLRFNFGNQ